LVEVEARGNGTAYVNPNLKDIVVSIDGDKQSAISAQIKCDPNITIKAFYLPPSMDGECIFLLNAVSDANPFQVRKITQMMIADDLLSPAIIQQQFPTMLPTDVYRNFNLARQAKMFSQAKAEYQISGIVRQQTLLLTTNLPKPASYSFAILGASCGFALIKKTITNLLCRSVTLFSNHRVALFIQRWTIRPIFRAINYVLSPAFWFGRKKTWLAYFIMFTYASTCAFYNYQRNKIDFLKPMQTTADAPQLYKQAYFLQPRHHVNLAVGQVKDDYERFVSTSSNPNIIEESNTEKEISRISKIFNTSRKPTETLDPQKFYLKNVDSVSFENLRTSPLVSRATIYQPAFEHVARLELPLLEE
jgi:hypothetical protein